MSTIIFSMNLFYLLLLFPLIHARSQKAQLENITNILTNASFAFDNFSNAIISFNGGNATNFFLAYDTLTDLVLKPDLKTMRQTKSLSGDHALKVGPLIRDLAASIRGAMDGLVQQEEELEHIIIGNEFCESVGPPWVFQALLRLAILVKDLVREFLVRVPREMIQDGMFSALEDIPKAFDGAWKEFEAKGVGKFGESTRTPVRRGMSTNCPKRH